MSYEVTSDILIERLPKFIEAGIHEVKLTNVRVDVTQTGKNIFEYEYTNNKGQRGTKTEWEIGTPSYVAEMSPAAQQEWKDKQVELQKARVLMVASKFVPIEKLTGKFNSFVEFVTHVKNVLETDSNYKEISLRVKFTYDKDGFSTTPNYTYPNWIERVDLVPSDKSEIEILPKDRMEKSKRESNANTRNGSPLLDDTSTNENPSKGNNDLPF